MSHLGKDLPESEPTLRVPLKWVGIEAIPHTLGFKPEFDGDPNPVYMACNISMFSSLSKTRRGVHISRLPETLVEEMQHGPFSMFQFCRNLADSIREVERQDCAMVKLICKHTIQRKTSVTKKPTLIPLLLGAELTASPSGFIYNPSLELEIMIMCPCVVEMSKANNRGKSRKQMNLRETGLGDGRFSHSQRAMLKLSVFSQEAIRHSELLDIAERVAGIVGTTVKRPDELQLIQKALRNPAFCEDIVRKTLCLLKTHFKRLPKMKVLKVAASIQSHESIHPFSIIASGDLSLRRDLGGIRS